MTTSPILNRAPSQVRSASLSGGGYLGTEYPLMLRLRYRDAAGNGQTWYRGFYYQNPELRPIFEIEDFPAVPELVKQQVARSQKQ